MSQLFIPSSPDNLPLPSRNENLPPSLKFLASTIHVGHLAESLSAITSVSTQALMIISESGITIYAEYNHIVNVQLTIDASLFSTYSLSGGGWSQNSQNGELRLGIDAQLVSDSLAAAASTALPRAKSGGSGVTAATSDTVVCYMKYFGEGHPLIIEFDDRLISELIEFVTFHFEFEYPYDADENENASELLVNHELIQLEVILKSDLLANLLLDLQQLNTQVLHLYASNATRAKGKDGLSNQLNFISKGSIGYLKLIFPNAKTMLERMEIFRNCNGSMTPTHDSILSSFNFLPFLRIFRAVKLSTRCKMMKDVSGVFSVQLLCKNVNMSSYPGTLITFNMLEMSTNADEFGQLNEVDINTLFDDELYQHVMEYDPAQEALSPAVGQRTGISRSEPFTYASFKMTNNSAQTYPEDKPSAKRRRDNDGGDENSDHDFTTVGGAVEVPLFL